MQHILPLVQIVSRQQRGVKRRALTLAKGGVAHFAPVGFLMLEHPDAFAVRAARGAEVGREVEHAVKIIANHILLGVGHGTVQAVQIFLHFRRQRM